MRLESEAPLIYSGLSLLTRSRNPSLQWVSSMYWDEFESVFKASQQPPNLLGSNTCQTHLKLPPSSMLHVYSKQGWKDRLTSLHVWLETVLTCVYEYETEFRSGRHSSCLFFPLGGNLLKKKKKNVTDRYAIGLSNFDCRSLVLTGQLILSPVTCNESMWLNHGGEERLSPWKTVNCERFDDSMHVYVLLFRCALKLCCPAMYWTKEMLKQFCKHRKNQE